MATDGVKASTRATGTPTPSGPSTKPPAQATTQVRMPPSDNNRVMNTNDPITNAAEEQRAQMDQEDQDARAEEERKRQEEEAKKQQEQHEQRMSLMRELVESPEGFVVRTEDNMEAVSLALRDGQVYMNNVQAGKGGLDVEERVFLSSQGYDALRTAFGPEMGKNK